MVSLPSSLLLLPLFLLALTNATILLPSHWLIATIPLKPINQKTNIPTLEIVLSALVQISSLNTLPTIPHYGSQATM